MASAPRDEQFAQGEAIAQALGDNAVATVTINNICEGIPPERVVLLISNAIQGKQAEVNEVARRLSASEDATTAFLQMVNEESVAPELLAQKLAEIAVRHLLLLERLSVVDSDDSRVVMLVQAAAQLIEKVTHRSDYARADELLAQAQAVQDEELQRRLKISDAVAESVRRGIQTKASLIARRGELLLAQFDYVNAAKLFDVAASTVSDSDLSMFLGFRFSQFQAQLQHGIPKRDLLTLERTEQACRLLSIDVDERGTHLARALTTAYLASIKYHLGMVSEDMQILREAASLCKLTLAALDDIIRPMAVAKMHFGSDSYVLVGSLLENDVSVLSVSTTHPIAEEQRTRTAILFAIILRIIGEREGSQEVLQAGKDFILFVLTTVSRGEQPELWSELQFTLGNVSLSLSEYGVARVENLQEARNAFQGASEEYSVFSAPYEWAALQSHLGATLRRLGESERDSLLLEQAIDCFEPLLANRNLGMTDAGIGQIQHNLATAKSSLYELNESPRLIDESINLYKEALLVRRRAEIPLEWALTKNNLGIALWRRACASGSQSELLEAKQCMEDALLERTEQRAPFDRAGSILNLGQILLRLGWTVNGIDYLFQAVNAFAEARFAFQKLKVESLITAADVGIREATELVFKKIGKYGSFRTKVYFALLFIRRIRALKRLSATERCIKLMEEFATAHRRRALHDVEVGLRHSD